MKKYTVYKIDIITRMAALVLCVLIATIFSIVLYRSPFHAEKSYSRKQVLSAFNMKLPKGAIEKIGNEYVITGYPISGEPGMDFCSIDGKKYYANQMVWKADSSIGEGRVYVAYYSKNSFRSLEAKNRQLQVRLSKDSQGLFIAKSIHVVPSKQRFLSSTEDYSPQLLSSSVYNQPIVVKGLSGSRKAYKVKCQYAIETYDGITSGCGFAVPCEFLGMPASAVFRIGTRNRTDMEDFAFHLKTRFQDGLHLNDKYHIREIDCVYYGKNNTLFKRVKVAREIKNDGKRVSLKFLDCMPFNLSEILIVEHQGAAQLVDVEY